ncbi:hypothetical protein KW805_02310 [Candidatus Pacearchaeota archaeon]|nr:hypothetical protein [Candidatus Pacearchaeota archaeon]
MGRKLENWALILSIVSFLLYILIPLYKLLFASTNFEWIFYFALIVSLVAFVLSISALVIGSDKKWKPIISLIICVLAIAFILIKTLRFFP